MSKAAIIFGSSGFIGSALCRRLTELNYEVYGCDLFNSGMVEGKNFFLPSLLEKNPESIFNKTYSLCINCAGSASVPFSFKDPFKDYELNTRIVFTILSELNKFGSRARFINMSSAAVYGNPARLPIKEMDTLNPISPYGNHKLMSEMIVEQFRNYFNIEAISLRIFSAYGPGLEKQIFWDLHQKALQSHTILMHGTGHETRDFIYIHDLINAIMLIAETKEKTESVYNIGNGCETKIKEVVELFCKFYDNDLKYEFNNVARVGDPNNWRADISRLAALDYKPHFTMEKGIYEFVKWAQKIK